VTARRHGLDRIRRIHLIGIGGAGMGGIAEVLHTLGFEVSGSDLHANEMTGRLSRLGVRVHSGHHPEHVQDCDVVVVSTAIPPGNSELEAARERQVPVVPRAEMLGEIMRFRHGIAVAGTHGKTTTTSLITAILQRAGLDPTYVIGGLLKSEGRNARLGAGRYIVAEADESDASFLFLQPMAVVVTNIDRDHLASYRNDFEQLKRAFLDFVGRLPFYGVAVLCIDDDNVRSMIEDCARPVLTYGLREDADFRAVDLVARGMRWTFTATRPAGSDLDIELPLPGVHNVSNALAAIAVATEEGVSDDHIVDGLRRFKGVGRRFEVASRRVNGKCITLVDDYGHHPTEVRAVIETARSVWPERRLVMVYQPHRYTRTQELYDDFVKVLLLVDLLLIVEVYAAGEDMIAGADGRALCRGVRRFGGTNPLFAATPDEALEILRSLLRNDDVVIVQGAGNVSRVSRGLEESSNVA
jgi:UDP-N-acetylmuramate--alanine ligase